MLNEKQVIEDIKKKSGFANEITYRELEIKGKIFNIIYVDSLVDSNSISDFVIKSMFEIINTKYEEELEKNNVKIIKYATSKIDIKEELQKKLFATSLKDIDYMKDDVFYYIYSGFVLLLYDKKILAVELKKNLSRAITEPTTEGSIKGAKDSFVENYKTNLGLIRRRIKSEKMQIEEMKVGRLTKTDVGIVYISNIAKKEHVDEIKKKISEFDIDGILDSNDIREMIIAGGSTTDFPTILNTERPDLVSSYLMQGRIAIVVDNTPYVLVLPAFLADNFRNIDDYYQKSNTIYFIRIVRILAYLITLVTPAMYIALTTFNQEALPGELLISFAVQRSGVPFPAVIEAFTMIIAFEFLREGDNRVPSIMGSTLSIVGALVIGEAAVSAGIVSPIMLIVIAITKISGLLFSDINFSNAVRSWRLIYLIFASLAGLFGFMIASVLHVFKLASLSILDTSYIYPFSPFDKEEVYTDTLGRKNISELSKRKKVLTDNLTRLIKR
ncbi:MAG: spore germination protein [Clostridia bacterium]|nr:spore germination protein [Clostridia bacterium]